MLGIQLVGLCHDLGLHLDSSSWPIPPGDKRRRKRLWWALYMQDKWSVCFQQTLNVWLI
jgi:hypothetical protein